MGNIVLLDDLTINKIAAGEVIERPASVVKELMENSIDAGATTVTAEIKNGGISYIRITDNGKGFLPDDMEIAFERHATSKIRSAKDLEEVKSMGFRGEALASIAAIAHVELTSRTADSEVGYKIVVEGGKIISKEVTGCPRGTTIVVENLFFNTPVRYKFLKKDFTELGYVEDAVTRIALVNPNIAVKLISFGKSIIQTTGNGVLKDTVYSIYGKDIAENIVNVDYQFEDMSVKGCIGKANIAKSNRTNQLFFVNGRYVKDKTLTSAADQAFKGLLPVGKYGFLILNLEIDSHQIDVNVHPAKLEIRFQEENRVFKLVYHAIKESLIQDNYNESKQQEDKKENKEEDILELIKEGYNTKFDSKELEKQREFIYSNKVDNSDEQISNINEDNADFSSNTGNLIEDIFNDKMNSIGKSNYNNFEDDESKNKNVDNNSENSQIDDVVLNEKSDQDNSSDKKEEPSEESLNEKVILDSTFEEMYRKTFGKLPVDNKTNSEKNEKKEEKSDFNIETAEDVVSFENRNLFNKVKYKYIGIAFSSYVIVEIEKELYIIDQRSANERIMYEKLKKNYYSDTQKDAQMMLLPDIINLTHKEMDIAKDNMLLFKKAGFEVEEFGENTVKLTGVPTVCLDLDTKELFLECLNEINTVARTAKKEIEEKFIATVACKVATKFKLALTFEEVDNLMQKLLILENPFVNPNGKSIAIKLSQADIEKKFSKK